MFQKNQRICLRADNSQKGRVNDIPIPTFYEIIWDNGDIETIRESELLDEIIIQTPWERLANNEFDDYRNFTISSIINKIRNTSANTISTLKASKTIFKPYQFIPLLKILNSEKRRIIIADEVGLGKTISAGHIVLELAARGELNSLLVVCLNSIQEKWIDELQNKFNIRIKKFEKIIDFKLSLSNAQKYNDKIFGIINYDKFRQQKSISFFEKNARSFDLIIFDEAHTLRNDTNARKSLKAFTELANAIICLTATPIMTSLENLYNLVKLIDEENYSNYQIFQNSININKPFIKAYNELNAGIPTKQIAEKLKKVQVENHFKYGEYEFVKKYTLNELLVEDSLYQKIISELEYEIPLSHKRKVHLQEMLVNLNSLSHIYTRTRKDEVLTDGKIVRRNANVIEIEMNEVEAKIYREIMSKVNDDIGGIQIKRKYASSLFADKFTEEEYSLGVKKCNWPDNKYTALIDIIRQESSEQIIIFAFFRKTLLYLKNRLEKDGFRVGLIFGGIDMVNRNKVINDFKDRKFLILLSSEVGSTGLDMQFCDRMVNYDLPWNPMVIEQRIGRIDRIGQQSQVINIFNFIYRGTIEEQIYLRLYDRIGLFREALGNLDEILGGKEAYIEGEIEKIYRQNLSVSEIKQRLDIIASAIEKNKLDLRRIDNGLRDSFSSDLYFENEIKDIEKNKKYLTEGELLEIIQRIIANKLTTLALVQSRTNQYEFLVIQPKQNIIFDFIEENYDSTNTELVSIYKEFKVGNIGNTIRCTFNQEYAYANKGIEYISAYHPFINAIASYFQKNKYDHNAIYRFSINRNNLMHYDINNLFHSGYYFLIRYDYEINKNINGRMSKLLYHKSMVINLNGDEFIAYDNETSDSFYSICQDFKENISEEGIISFANETINELKKIYTEYVLLEKTLFEQSERMKFESELVRKTNQEISDINSRIKRIERNIQDNIGIQAIQVAEIRSLIERKDKLLYLKKISALSVKSKIVSLNYIYIYE